MNLGQTLTSVEAQPSSLLACTHSRTLRERRRVKWNECCSCLFSGLGDEISA